MAFTKKSAKGRLDKYYHLAKEQGYRARSAFKLIQLNQKYEFLENSRVLVDLCAAPGGWLQVASKYMPLSKVIIGVDLVSIKPLPGVTTIVSDITTAECRHELHAALQGWKADVVLHDGAPNVGASWDHDAYAQVELVLHSLRLATEILRPGGLFVTKVFRSKDYNALLYVFNTLFKSVEATKPASSRNVSAEIFVICRDFVAPKKIDPKLLDAKNVFAITSQAQSDAKVSSTSINILRPDKQKRNRDGYEDGMTMLYKEIDLDAFIMASDPIALLSSANAIIIPDDFTLVKPSPNIISSCADLKILGRREFNELLKWRLKIRKQLKKKESNTSLQHEVVSEAKTEETTVSENPEDTTKDLQLMQQMISKSEKKARKKAFLRKAKERTRLLSGFGVNNDLAELHDQELFTLPSALVEIPEDDQGVELSDSNDQNEEEDEDMLVSMDLDEQLERMYEQYKQHRSKVIIPLDEDPEDALTQLQAIDKIDENADEDQDSNSNELELLFSRKTFKNFEEDEDLIEPSGRRATAKAKKQKSSSKSNSCQDTSIELVPAEESYLQNGQETADDDIDIDNNEEYKQLLAKPEGISLALALRTPLDEMEKVAEDEDDNKMKRLIDDSFNRYSFDDRHLNLPSWFVEDESSHNVPQIPITAEAVQVLKAQLRTLAARQPKRVREAKARTKSRALRRLASIQARFGAIAENEEISEAHKSAEFSKAVAKAKKLKPKGQKKVLVVAKGSNKGLKGRPKGVRGRYKMVDARMKKETRRLNARNKRKR